MNGSNEGRSDWSLRDLSGRVLRRAEKNGTMWTWKEDYIYRDCQLLAAEDSVTGRKQFHLDHLGSPRLITNSSGVEISRHAYYPFGVEIPETRTTDTERRKFTGHERDIGSSIATDLDYMHARHYSAAWGRFLSVDPLLEIKEALHEPQLWNRYSYVTNNPLKFTDEDGRYRTFYKEKAMRWQLLSAAACHERFPSSIGS